MRIQTDGEPRNSEKIVSLLKLLEINQPVLPTEGAFQSQTTPLGMFGKQSLSTKKIRFNK